MTNQEHPITPPPEMVEQWMLSSRLDYDVFSLAAQWGYQQAVEELEAFLRKGHDKG
jgi:hypothetical protein